MSNTWMTEPSAYLSSGSLALFTMTMLVIVFFIKWLLKEMSHAIVILLSFGISSFFVPQGMTLLNIGLAISAMQYLGASSLFAVIALSEASYLIANWGRKDSQNASD